MDAATAKSQSAADEPAANEAATREFGAHRSVPAQATESPTTPDDVAEEPGRTDGVEPGRMEELRRVAMTSGYAVMGATDVALERLRDYQGRFSTLRDDLASRTVSGEFRRLQNTVSEWPTEALHKGADAAERAEEHLDDLADRGRGFVGRVLETDPARTWVGHAESAWARGRTFVETTRRSAANAQAQSRRTVQVAADGVGDAVGAVKDGVTRTAGSVAHTAGTVGGAAQRVAADTVAAAKHATGGAGGRPPVVVKGEVVTDDADDVVAGARSSGADTIDVQGKATGGLADTDLGDGAVVVDGWDADGDTEPVGDVTAGRSDGASGAGSPGTGGSSAGASGVTKGAADTGGDAAEASGRSGEADASEPVDVETSGGTTAAAGAKAADAKAGGATAAAKNPKNRAARKTAAKSATSGTAKAGSKTASKKSSAVKRTSKARAATTDQPESPESAD